MTTIETDTIQLDIAGVARSPRTVAVSDAVLVQSGVVDLVSAPLGCDVLVIEPGEPRVETAVDLAERLAAFAPHVVVAVGGGSVLDTTKLAARYTTDPRAIEAVVGGTATGEGGPRVVAVPTTAGTGSEATRTSVVTQGSRKAWVWGDRLRFDDAVLAPELTVGLPESVTVASGLDAFIHCVEGGLSLRGDPGFVPVAVAAAGDIRRALPDVLDRPRDLELRRSLLGSAHAGGSVIDRCGTGIGHGVGHALASLTSIPHGLAVMACHRAALEWTIDGAPGAYDAFGTPEAVVAMFDGLIEDVGLAGRLRTVEFPDPSDLAVELTAAVHRPMLDNSPRSVGEDDLRRLADATIRMWAA